MTNLTSSDLLALRELPVFCKHRDVFLKANGNVYGLWQMLKTSCSYPRGCPRYVSCCQMFMPTTRIRRTKVTNGWKTGVEGEYLDMWEIDHIPRSHHRRV